MIAALLLMTSLAGVAPTSADARLLTGVVASAAAHESRLDVLTAEDIRTTADLEASKQMLGCEAETSCLLEMASALGAQFIITGTIGSLGSEPVLQLTILDVTAGRAVGRDTLQGRDVAELARAAQATTAQRLSALEVPSGPRPKLMVLDFALVAAGSDTTPPVAQAGSPLPVIGGSVLAASALALAAGGVVDWLSVSNFNAVVATSSAAEATSKYAASDGLAVGAGILYVAGGVGVVVGGVVLAVGLLSAGE
jgi:hypothetical protein